MSAQDKLREALKALCALEADGLHASEGAIEYWERARAALAAQEAELPPLPEPTQGLGSHRWAYSADDMRAERQRCYELGVAAERERCAKKAAPELTSPQREDR